MTQEFKNWYEKEQAVFLDKTKMPSKADDITNQHISMSFGVYQRFFLEKYGLMIYAKSDYDKFSIHIEDCLKKYLIYQSSLINNNIDSVQKILVEKAFDLTKDKIYA